MRFFIVVIATLLSATSFAKIIDLGEFEGVSVKFQYEPIKTQSQVTVAGYLNVWVSGKQAFVASAQVREVMEDHSSYKPDHMSTILFTKIGCGMRFKYHCTLNPTEYEYLMYEGGMGYKKVTHFLDLNIGGRTKTYHLILTP